ncbi:extracellular calcium-sensing receptor-like isoform X1 [Astyanax mexicanus]|uniref:extracellular calcium-sensing receptor-like isoform X1 n=2 Tax=Astyanax mexicanus TaxID=7994 RepID=UPI000BBDF7FB|nr:extracellular calcium-sensing receptor-like isoform X1 [Astyanax mexicanus]
MLKGETTNAIGSHLSLEKFKAIPCSFLSFICQCVLYYQCVAGMAHHAIVFTCWFLLIVPMLCQFINNHQCIYQGEERNQNFYQDGDVIVGGLFPLHYTPVTTVWSFQKKPAPTEYKYLNPRALRWMSTMTFAVMEINQRKDLLPNLTLGYHIRDSSDDIPTSLKGSLLLVNGQPDMRQGSSCAEVRRQPSPVIVGDAASGVSMAVLRTLGSFSVPLVSYFASCSCLSNKKEFPAFMRTMPSDEFQIKALAKLVHYYQWTWVGVIGVESDYARFAVQLFLKESVRYDVCIAYVHFYPVTLSREALRELLGIIEASTATVILSFSGELELQTILKECRRQNITHLQWIASEAWATAKTLWSDFSDMLQGTLGFAIRKAEIPNLYSYLRELNTSSLHVSSFLGEFWEETFNCRINGSLNTHIHKEDVKNRGPCSGEESLDDVYNPYTDVTQLRVSYNVYKAVYVIAHALHDMSTCVPGEGPFQNGTCGSLNPILPWQLLRYMKRTSFTTLGEDVRFDENGDPIASYDLMNWQVAEDGSLLLVKVGFFDASLEEDKDLVINESMIMWHRGDKAPESVCSKSCLPGSRKARRKGEPICCFDCIPCGEGEISNQTDSIDCLRCSKETWPNQARDQCMPKTLEYLSFQEPLGIVLWAVSTFGAFLTATVLFVFVIYRKTPVIRGNNMELSFLLLLFLCACFLIGLTFIGKPSNWLCQIRYTAFGISFALCIACILAKTVVVLMAFRATLPGSNVMKWFGPAQQRLSVILCSCVQALICIIWLTTKPPSAAYNTEFMSATIIVECNVGSELGFWCVLGYIGLLACMCFLIAFFARKLPDNYNEAKFITFSILIFFAVWITFIPVYVSTRGKYMVAVHVFAILASAFGLLLCIFAPKCYIVLLRPDKNSKKHMMKK